MSKRVLMVGGPAHGEVYNARDDCYMINVAPPPPLDMSLWSPDNLADPMALITLDVITYIVKPGVMYGQRMWFATENGMQPDQDEIMHALRHTEGGRQIAEACARQSYEHNRFGRRPDPAPRQHPTPRQMDEAFGRDRYRERMPMRQCTVGCWYATQGFFACTEGCVHQGRST